jgi:hypothetical protein
MSREQKINWIKLWLQKFGDRNNETFCVSVIFDDGFGFDISLQYDFSEDGDEIDPYCFCKRGFKDLRGYIEDRTDEELNKIIDQLIIRKAYY